MIIDVSNHERTSALVYRAPDDRRTNVTMVLAHGAGAGHTSPFMVKFATGLASRGLDVLTFNFLYTEQRRKGPDRPDKLEACYRAAVAAAHDFAAFSGNAMFIGGKSMGGRIASYLAAAPDASAHRIKGLVLLGYPLHPPGKPDQLRASHFASIHVPTLFIQGSRDPFGTPTELRPHLDRLGAESTLHVVENSDHSLAPAKGSGMPVDEGYAQLQDVIAKWTVGVLGKYP